MATLEVGLYDSDTDELITLLSSGQTISAADIAGKKLAISATVIDENGLPASVESVKLNLDSGSFVRTESVAPYALFGDSNGDFNGQANILATGAHNITLDLFDQDGGGGSLLDTLSIDFSVTDDSGPGPGPGGGATGGEASFSILANHPNVQVSNYGSNSFSIENTGNKVITEVVIDVTGAILPDAVFDPFGLAGDKTFKALTIDTDGGTGVNAPSSATYIGVGGIAGYEAIKLTFDENSNGGFEPGESISFSIDMDPNSIAGADKTTIDSGASPSWDIGGISGAELIGSTYTITFADGTTATGQLQGDGSQAGAQGVASQDSPNISATLLVNGLGAGSAGNYGDGGPTVIVSGPAGETARIVLLKGIIQPVDNNFTGSYGDQLDQQLADLAASDFPANNAAQFQTVNVLLTGGAQDISSLFNFTDVPNYALAVPEDELPLAFTVGIIDPSQDDKPIGPVSAPIFVTYSSGVVEPPAPELTLSVTSAFISENGGTTDLTVTRNGDLVGDLTVTLNSSDTSELTVPTTVVIPNGQASATVTLSAVDDSEIDGTQSQTVSASAPGFPSAGITVNVTDDDVATTPELTLAVSSSSISENGGTTDLTVTRNGDLVGDLTVTLNSSDTSELTVPTTVVIPNGQASATVTLSAVDDSEVDGTQTQTVSASAPGFPAAGIAVSVTDDEVAQTPEVLVELIDADTDTVITTIEEGKLINSSLVEGKSLAISVSIPSGSGFEGQVGSVKLDLNNGQNLRLENVAPYALFGDSGGNFLGKTNILLDGTNNISIDLFAQVGGSGGSVGSLSLDFTVGDGPANLAPDASLDTASTAEDTTTNIDVLINDSDPENDALTVVKINGQSASVGAAILLASGALVTLNADNSLSYDPNGAFNALDDGEDALDLFDYTISDGNGNEATAQVGVTVNGVDGGVVPPSDGPPVFTSLASATVTEGQTQVINVNTIDEDQPVVYTLTGGADVSLFNIDSNSGIVTFKTAPAFNQGGDNEYTFVVTATDQDNEFATQTITATVQEAPSGETYLEGVETSTGYRFKWQIESSAGGPNGGENPGGMWHFIAEGSAEDQFSTPSQGSGFYLWGDASSLALNGVQADSVLEYKIYIPEGHTGLYTARFTVGSLGLVGDRTEQNDLWFNVVQDATGATVEDLFTNDSEFLESNGYAKLVGLGPNFGEFGIAWSIDAEPNNFLAQVNLAEPGFYTIQVAGRSQGYFIDYVDFYKGLAPAASEPDTPVVNGSLDTVPSVNQISDLTIADEDSVSINLSNAFFDADGDVITISEPLSTIPSGFTLDVNAKTLTAPTGLALGDYDIDIVAQDEDGNVVSNAFTVTVVDEITGPGLPDVEVGIYDATTDTLLTLIEDGGVYDFSLVEGKSVTISATVDAGSEVESIFLNLNGQFSRGESVEPFALFGDSAGDYFGKQNIFNEGSNTVSLDLYSADGLGGDDLGTLLIDFDFV